MNTAFLNVIDVSPKNKKEKLSPLFWEEIIILF